MHSTGENGAAASERPCHPCCTCHPAFFVFPSSSIAVNTLLSFMMDSMVYIFLLNRLWAGPQERLPEYGHRYESKTGVVVAVHSRTLLSTRGA
jgi:hypothetical protein